MPGARWFPGARLNYAENLLRHRGSSPAVIATGEGQDDRVVSRDDLIETCWDGRVVGEDAITLVMMKLRKLQARWDAEKTFRTPNPGDAGCDCIVEVSGTVMMKLNGVGLRGAACDAAA